MTERAPDPCWSSLPVAAGVQLIDCHPAGLAAWYKPEGQTSHPNPGEKDPGRCWLAGDYDHARECFAVAGGRDVYLLHRLDAATSGVFLTAATAVLAKSVKALFQQRKVEKEYVALVFGQPAWARQVWSDPMQVQRSHGQLRARSGGRSLAVTHVQVQDKLGGDPPLTLLRLFPKTGRTHQLRWQCGHHGLPIVGDQTYGDFAANRSFRKTHGHKRLFLHALRVVVPIVWKGRGDTFHVRAPLPVEFEQIFQG